jgi:hypothetical protein
LEEYNGRQFDVIVADHSLEHVPKLDDTLDAWMKLAAPAQPLSSLSRMAAAVTRAGLG